MRILLVIPLLVGCATLQRPEFRSGNEPSLEDRKARQCFETGLIWQEALHEYCTNPDTGMEGAGYDEGGVEGCIEAVAGSADELLIVQLYVSANKLEGSVDLRRCLGGD